MDKIIEDINNKKKILIISTNKHSLSNVSKVYFALFHNKNYYQNISISGIIIINTSVRLCIHGNVSCKKEMKQIHFVNTDNLKPWMKANVDSVYDIEDYCYTNILYKPLRFTLINPRYTFMFNDVITNDTNKYLVINMNLTSKPKLIDFIAPDYIKHKSHYKNVYIKYIEWGTYQRVNEIGFNKLGSIESDSNDTTETNTKELNSNKLNSNKPNKCLKYSKFTFNSQSDSFSAMIEELIRDLDGCNSIIFLHSDIYLNTLLAECDRHFIKTDFLNNKLIFDVKQHIWKRWYNESIRSIFSQTDNTQTGKVEFINHVYNSRIKSDKIINSTNVNSSDSTNTKLNSNGSDNINLTDSTNTKLTNVNSTETINIIIPNINLIKSNTKGPIDNQLTKSDTKNNETEELESDSSDSEKPKYFKQYYND